MGKGDKQSGSAALDGRGLIIIENMKTTKRSRMEENMEKRRSKGKVIALILSIVVVVGLLTTGIVLAATGKLSDLFTSDKAKAFQLLSQAPEKMTETAIGEQLGQKELYEAMLEKGIDMNLKVSDMNIPEDEEVDLSGYSVELDAQVDLSDKKMGGKLAVEKNGTSLSAQGYASLEEKKVAFSLPELIAGKSFSMTATDSESQDTLNQIQEILSLLPDLQESFTEYVETQGDALYEATECTDIDTGYRLMIPKAAMDQVLNDFKTYLTEEQDTIHTIEENLELPSGTIYSAINSAIPTFTSYTKDFTFEVYGEDGELTGLQSTIQVDGGECRINASFRDSDEQRNVTISLVLDDGSSAGEITYTLNTKKGDVCEDSIQFVVAADGVTAYSMNTKQTLDLKNNNAYTMDSSIEIMGEGNATVTGRGSIKNLEPGKCVTMAFDEISLSDDLGIKMSYGMESTLSVLDGEVAALSGEEVAITPETAESVLKGYASDMQTKLIEVMTSWRLTDLITGSGYGGSSDTDLQDDSVDDLF